MIANKKDQQVVKIVLFIQGGLLLLSTIFYHASEYKQESINDELTKTHSRFLELIQQENSISDSRLEFLEMIILKDHLKLNGTQSTLFNNDIKNISERYNKKINEYDPDEYRKDYDLTNTTITDNEDTKSWFKLFALLSTVLAFCLNMYSIWKLRKFPLQSSP